MAKPTLWTVQSVGFANPWTATAAAHLMPLDYGLDAEDVSVRDWAGIEGGTNFAVGEGIGTLVQRLGEAIPVSLGAPVSQITRNRDSLTLTTSKGAVTARAALITVSAPVLASGTIGLKGVVPVDVLDAAANMTMGNLEKVALALTPDKAATYPANTLLIPKLRDERTYYVHMRPHGQPVAIYYAGGRWARTLAAMPLSGASAEARAALADMLGSAALKAVTRASATNWAGDARFRGSYSAVKVNALPARLNLAKPFASDVFLAGEALGERRAQSLDGAWWSGTRAAREILAHLRARQL
ncbi:MAG TPA: hypothetical protein DCL54_01520 [Alphaproteobacteria bacterium]|nr:hypothetical protein [Alphaproteobacteria bacterium]